VPFTWSVAALLRAQDLLMLMNKRKNKSFSHLLDAIPFFPYLCTDVFSHNLVFIESDIPQGPYPPAEPREPSRG
jgi:hypothetical protein